MIGRSPDALPEVASQELAAYDVQVSVGLALHSVPPEVRKYAEAIGTAFLSYLSRQVAHLREQVAAAPELCLRHVRLGNDENLHRNPVELVVEDDDALILEVDGGRFAARDDVAEYAGMVWHRWLAGQVRAKMYHRDKSDVSHGDHAPRGQCALSHQ